MDAENNINNNETQSAGSNKKIIIAVAIGLGIFVCVILSCLALGYFVWQSDLISLPAQFDLSTPPERNHTDQNFNTLGAPDAPVEIIILSDFGCSHCRNFYRDTEALLIEDYVTPGLVSYQYRSYSNPDHVTGRAAEAAYCAGDQDNFWQMHDYLFANFETAVEEQYSSDFLIDVAKQIGLNAPKFEDCLTSNDYYYLVQEDQLSAIEMGAMGTPTFFINGVMIEGNVPYDVFQAEIEKALSDAGY